MAIYDISGVTNPLKEERSSQAGANAEASQTAAKEKSSILSAILSRLFFAALLLLDLAWGVYALFFFLCAGTVYLCTFKRVAWLKKRCDRSLLSIKRSLACGLALIAAIFSPAFGIMIACTYFLMYDRNGIEEVIPASLQDQFRDFFKQ